MIGSPSSNQVRSKNARCSTDFTEEVPILGELVDPGCSRHERRRLTGSDVLLDRTSLTDRPAIFNLARPKLPARNGAVLDSQDGFALSLGGKDAIELTPQS